MSTRTEKLTYFGKKIRDVKIEAQMCDVLDEIVAWRMETKQCDEKTAIEYALSFFVGVCCGEQSTKDENETAWFILWHDCIVNMFIGRHGYPPLYV